MKGFALFALGFRPFFLAAGLSALLLMLLWLLILGGNSTASSYYPGNYWHSHEMLFGFVATVAAGFLLTAVRNWTGVQTLRFTPLALLSLLWLLGRLAPLSIFQLPGWLIALVDLSFLPVAAVGVAIPILRKSQKSNYVFPILLLVMAMANLLTHMQFLGLSEQTADTGISLMLYLVVALIMIMGGRVIPFFSERGVMGLQTRSWPLIETLVPYSIGAAALVASFLPDSILLAPVALFAAAWSGFCNWVISGWSLVYYSWRWFPLLSSRVSLPCMP